MCLSLWEQAQGKLFYDDTVKRCDKCGRRIIDSDDCFHVLRGFTEPNQKAIIDVICHQHGKEYDEGYLDCLTEQEVDFGRPRGWGRIFASNVLNEAVFWIHTIARFLRLCGGIGISILLRLRAYYEFRKKWRVER